MLHALQCLVIRVQAEKEALKKMPPADLFRHETDKYSKFDEKVTKVV